MPESCFIEIDGSRIHYLLTRGGERLVVAFHGYGMEAGSMQPLADALASGYTCVSVDLPHHGATEWGTQPLDRKRLNRLLRLLAEQYGLRRFWLAGYSLGGRICLTIAEMMPELIEGIVLIAPDGLVFNRAYHLATRNIAGRWLFRSVLENPAGFFAVAGWLLRRKMLSASKHKFVTQHLETRAARDLLGKVWRDTTELVPDQRRLKQNLLHYRIPVRLFMGKYDSVIPVEHAEKFREGLPCVEVTYLQKGHRILDAQTAAQIAQTMPG